MFSVITVNYVVADGQSNWLEGMILMCLYVIIVSGPGPSRICTTP